MKTLITNFAFLYSLSSVKSNKSGSTRSLASPTLSIPNSSRPNTSDGAKTAATKPSPQRYVALGRGELK